MVENAANKASGGARLGFAPWDDGTAQPLLRFDAVGKRYGDSAAVDELTLNVYEGEFFALLGPSGCGKTTLLRLVAGLDEATGGAVAVDGEPIHGTQSRISAVFQEPRLMPWLTVDHNVAFGIRHLPAAARRQRVAEALARVGLSAHQGHWPRELSGGMAQRVSLARALVNDPQILILDEPLGKLDSLTRLSMQTEIVSLWRSSGFTTLLVTHDVEEALFLAQRVIVFSDRPAKIKADIAVDREYPRRRGDPHLAELRREILGLLGLDATW